MAEFEVSEVEGKPGDFKVIPSYNGGILYRGSGRQDQIISLSSLNVGDKLELLTRLGSYGIAVDVEVTKKEEEKCILSSKLELSEILRK